MTVDIDHCSLSPHVLQHSHNKCFVSQNRKCTICQYICFAKMEIHCLILYRNVNFTVLFCMYFQRFPIFWFLKCVKGIFLKYWIYLSGFYVYILVCFKTFETFISQFPITFALLHDGVWNDNPCMPLYVYWKRRTMKVEFNQYM